MRLVAEIVGALWFCGTPLVALLAFVFAVRELLAHRAVSRRLLRALGVGAVGLVVLAAQPTLNMALFASIAQKYRTEMLKDAQQAACVGRSSVWLEARYGRPHEVRRDAFKQGIEHWWYTPGPWFMVHDDYVGFTVEGGLVTSVYIQVN